MIQLAIVLDDLGTVRESTVPGVQPGVSVDQLPWLARGVARLESAGAGHWELAIDESLGHSWLIGAAERVDTPRGLALAAIDLSSLLREDRAGLVAKVVHAVRNVAFATATVIDAAEADKPGPDQIGNYLRHIRRSTEGLAGAAEALLRATATLAPTDRTTPARLLVEAAETASSGAWPTLPLAGLSVRGDPTLLDHAIRALVGGGGRRATEVSVSLTEATERGVSGALRFEVVRPSSTTENHAASSHLSSPPSVWELTGPHELELVAGLSFVRRVVAASGGRVGAQAHPSGVFLFAELPLVANTAT